MTFSALLSLYLLASSASASTIPIRSSPITLPLAIRVNSTGGARALIERDRSRARAFSAFGHAKSTDNFIQVPVPVTDAAVTYTADVGVGNGTYTLLVDTGSSNTWVGAQPGAPYLPGPHSQDTGKNVTVVYGSGSFSGEEFLDTVKLGSTTITGQSIGAASQSQEFDDVDGILGIGPTDLTTNTTAGNQSIPTVTDNLKAQGKISSELIGISFVPTTSPSDQVNGQLDFGATDPSKFTGDIAYTPITHTSPASEFWGIDQSITFGSSNTPILNNSAGIVDTGTTLMLLGTEAFQAYQQATGATFDNATGLLKVDSEDRLDSLHFHIGDNTYEFTANAQIWPRSLNEEIGGQNGTIYLIVSDLGPSSGPGFNFVNGFVFLQRFYSVYDTDQSRVGFATTPHTEDTSN